MIGEPTKKQIIRELSRMASEADSVLTQYPSEQMDQGDLIVQAIRAHVMRRELIDLLNRMAPPLRPSDD